MTDTVWLSLAPMKSELTAWFSMEDRPAPEPERTRNAIAHRGGGHPNPVLLPQRAVEREGRKALNFGAKKNALAMKESRSVDGPNWGGNCAPKLWVKDGDFAVTRDALHGPDLWGDERVETGFFVSPRLGAALHKAGLAKVVHLLRCRVV